MMYGKGAVPSGYKMLDAPAILGVIGTAVRLSGWVVNVGAVPSIGEDAYRRVSRQADDVTPLWDMGYRGVNFDIAAHEKKMRFYQKWKHAKVDLVGRPPQTFAAGLREHGVPTTAGLSQDGCRLV